MQTSSESAEPESVGAPPLTVPVGVLGVTRTLLRWSAVIVPLAALSLYFSIVETRDIKPEFEATTSMLFVGPNEIRITDFRTDEVNIDAINPLSSLGGSLATVATVTAISMSDGSVYEQVLDEGLADDYAVSVDGRTPIINVQAWSTDSDLAESTLERLVELAVEDLDERQNDLGAPETERISIQRIDRGTLGDADYQARNRARIAFAVVGIGLSVASAFLLEGLYQLFRRYRTRDQRSAAPAEPVDSADIDREERLHNGEAGKSTQAEGSAAGQPSVDKHPGDGPDSKPTAEFADDQGDLAAMAAQTLRIDFPPPP